MTAQMMLADEAATAALGARIAPLLRPGDVLALEGGLGAGKTTLTRSILKALGLKGEAPSPTFTIVHMYDETEVILPVAHADLYRLDDPEDTVELGLDDYLVDGALIVEWPDRLEPRLRDAALTLHLEVVQDDARQLTARVPAAWRDRWPPR